ncbi:MAG: hypothetical protein R3Y60_02155 [bacterium]
MNKQKIKQRQIAAKKKKISRKEQADAGGIRRKKSKKPEMSLQLFYIIKFGLLIGIVFSFFFYSVLLLPLFIAYTSLYYFSTWAERKINRQFNKENQKRIFKFDAALAFITLVVSISTALYSFSTMVGNKARNISFYINRILSLSTGVRNNKGGSMGFGGKPSGGGMGGGMGNGTRPERPNFDLNDLPIEFAFNQILSSIVQILVFSVIIIGTLSVLVYVYKNYIKKDRLKIKENEKNEWKFSKEELIALLEEKI